MDGALSASPTCSEDNYSATVKRPPSISKKSKLEARRREYAEQAMSWARKGREMNGGKLQK